MARRSISAVSLASLLLAACGGQIEFGTARDASAVVPDAGTPDSGGPDIDSGEPGGPDTGEPDTGELPDTGEPPDTGCVKVFAATWPWARDKATYQDKFWTWASTQQGVKCTSSGCHGGTVTPLMPATDNELDITPTLNQAIDALWTTIVPSEQPGGVTTSLLGYAHKPIAQGGGGEAPPYSAAQQQFLDALVDSASTCQ
jgi:hypothetical protein